MINIFKAEQDLGLDLSDNAVSFTRLLKLKDTELMGTAKARYFNEFKTSAEDIFWYESILASVGMNLNDDIFTKEDLWNARATAVNKPVNYMHNNDDRIGHMVASVAINRAGEVIPDNTAIADLPDDFDIVTANVLYKLWDDPEKLARSQQMLDEIAEGIWKVSMECRFNHFDYGLTTATGEKYLIKREESTAFLTQFLRIYGGQGEWKGYKVGRVLRNFYFSAKGIVRNPANERSDILEDDLVSFAGAEIRTMESIKDTNMPESKTSDVLNETLMNELKSAYAEAKASATNEISRITTKLEETQAKHLQEIEDMKANFNELSAEAAEKMDKEKEEKEKAESTVTELTTAKEAAEAEVATLAAKVAELEGQVASLTTEKVVAERASKLAKANVDEATAKELLEVWADVSEAQFDSVVAAYTKDGKDGKKDEKEEEASAFNLDFESQEEESEGTFSGPSHTTDKGELDDIYTSLAAQFKS